MTELLVGPVRRLGPADVAACSRLAQDRNWLPEEHKWRLLFEVGHVYGIEASDGGLAGTAVATPYGRDVAAISMVLVAKRYERRGLGGRLMRHVLEHSGTASHYLTATEYGRPLYERLGFRAVGRQTTYIGDFHGEPQGVSQPARPEDMPEIKALDAEVFGAPRTAVLERLPDFGEQFRVVRDETGLVGFGGAWRGDRSTVIGPVIANDQAAALGLVADLAAAAGGPVRLDVDHRHAALAEWVKAHGLPAEYSVTVMEHGKPIAGDPARLFLPVMQALG